MDSYVLLYIFFSLSWLIQVLRERRWLDKHMRTNNKVPFVKITRKYNSKAWRKSSVGKTVTSPEVWHLLSLSVRILWRHQQSWNIAFSDRMYTTQCMSSFPWISPALFVFLVAVFYLSHTLFLWSSSSLFACFHSLSVPSFLSSFSLVFVTFLSSLIFQLVSLNSSVYQNCPYFFIFTLTLSSLLSPLISN